MDNLSVRAVFRISLPHSGYGEITAGHLLGGGELPFPHGAAVVLEVGAGHWIRRSELERIARSLGGVAVVSVSGTDVRGGGADDGGVVTGLGAIAEVLAHLISAPALFMPEVA